MVSIAAHSRIESRAPFALGASKPGVRDEEGSSDRSHQTVASASECRALLYCPGAANRCFSAPFHSKRTVCSADEARPWLYKLRKTGAQGRMDLHVRCVCLASLYWVLTACLLVPPLYWVLTTCQRRGRSWGSWWLARQWRGGGRQSGGSASAAKSRRFFCFYACFGRFRRFFF